MKPFFFAILAALLLPPVSLMAAVASAIISYSPDPSWQTSSGGTYLDLPIDTVTASRRLAVRFFVGGVLVAEVWDGPALRYWTVSVDLKSSPVAHLSLQAVAYEGGPWKSLTAFAAGEKLSVGDFPSTRYYMQATTAGMTGSVEPEWPRKHGFRLALAKTLAASDAVDLGGGAVGLPVPGHMYHAGDTVVVSGSTNYNGIYTLTSQTQGGSGVVVIPKAYTPETFLGTEAIAIANSAAVDNGNGTVNLPCPAHGFTAGQDVTIESTTNYDGTYTLSTQSDPDFLTITATYVAEQMGGGYAIDKTVSDGSVVWTFTDASTPITVLASDASRRIIARNRSGILFHSGTKFTLGTAP